MKRVVLTFWVDDEYRLKKLTCDQNETEFVNDSNFIGELCQTAVDTIELNKESMDLQDTLNELGIEKESNPTD